MPRLHYTFEILGAFIGALFGVLIADYYLVKKQRIVKDDLFTMSKTGTYWYKGGYNAKAVAVTVISAAVAVFPVLFGDLPGMTTAAQYSWFVGCGCRSRSAGPPCATARFRRPTSVTGAGRGGITVIVRLLLVNPNTTRSMTAAIGRTHTCWRASAIPVLRKQGPCSTFRCCASTPIQKV